MSIRNIPIKFNGKEYVLFASKEHDNKNKYSSDGKYFKPPSQNWYVDNEGYEERMNKILATVPLFKKTEWLNNPLKDATLFIDEFVCLW